MRVLARASRWIIALLRVGISIRIVVLGIHEPIETWMEHDAIPGMQPMPAFGAAIGLQLVKDVSTARTGGMVRIRDASKLPEGQKKAVSPSGKEHEASDEKDREDREGEQATRDAHWKLEIRDVVARQRVDGRSHAEEHEDGKDQIKDDPSSIAHPLDPASGRARHGSPHRTTLAIPGVDQSILFLINPIMESACAFGWWFRGFVVVSLAQHCHYIHHKAHLLRHKVHPK